MDLNKLKRYMIDINDVSNKEMRSSAWNNGLLIGLHYAEALTDEELEHMEEWSISNPIIETEDGYGTFEGEVKQDEKVIQGNI